MAWYKQHRNVVDGCSLLLLSEAVYVVCCSLLRDEETRKKNLISNFYIKQQ